jgi:hypothetical protein
MTSLTQELPLAGIRVIDYSHFLAGPYVGRCLAAIRMPNLPFHFSGCDTTLTQVAPELGGAQRRDRRRPGLLHSQDCGHAGRRRAVRAMRSRAAGCAADTEVSWRASHG